MAMLVLLLGRGNKNLGHSPVAAFLDAQFTKHGKERAIARVYIAARYTLICNHEAVKQLHWKKKC